MTSRCHLNDDYKLSGVLSRVGLQVCSYLTEASDCRSTSVVRKLGIINFPLSLGLNEINQEIRGKHLVDGPGTTLRASK
jgi:hypothetical protein